MEGVRKVYRSASLVVEALRDISFEIERGEFGSVMGPSGSGKSTLLNLLGCLDRPTEGRYWLDGHDVAALDDADLSRRRRHSLGFVFQSFMLIPQLTVIENIELPMIYAQLSRDARILRARELAEQVGLADRAHHRPSELSGGQRQRAAIARALANNPPVLLADEPTGNLDSRTGGQILELLGELHRNGRTIVLVTHEREVADHARMTIHMRDGAIERVERR
ncbi:MAG: ABC transporter ATP-binding protein [Kiritimatiellae bacterium]|nr:ABC transporter ATP-binding protein [Kiritimatiellia bacterium]